MKNSLIAFASVIMLFSLDVQSKACADYNNGVIAYKRGDYAAALRELRKAAEQGDDAAQTFLGGMYLFGKGVQQDDAEAVKWYREAVEHDNAHAQFRLGRMYYAGRGGPQDTILAHMWFSLAASQNHARSLKWRNFVAKRMTFVQLKKSRHLANRWKEKFQTNKKINHHNIR